jgi:hypothetical protein
MLSRKYFANGVAHEKARVPLLPAQPAAAALFKAGPPRLPGAPAELVCGIEADQTIAPDLSDFWRPA